MANEKMIVTDLDGTLLKNDKTISKNTIEAINELRMRGLGCYCNSTSIESSKKIS